MKPWQVYTVLDIQTAKTTIENLITEGYDKEDISLLVKSSNEEINAFIEAENISLEHPVNENAFGVISGILQSLSGGLVIPQVYNPDYGALYAAGPFAKWFSKTDDKTVRNLLEDFDLTEEQIDSFIRNLDAGNLLILAR